MVSGLFLSANTFANEPVPASKAVSNSVTIYITIEMEYPQFAIWNKYEGTVVVSLVIQDDGTFLVDASNGFNEDMREHVIETIHDLQSDYYAQYAGQQVLLKFNFALTVHKPFSYMN